MANTLSMHGAQVQFLLGELRSHMPHNAARKCVCVCVCVCMLAALLWLTLCDSMDCSPGGSSVHGIL